MKNCLLKNIQIIILIILPFFPLTAANKLINDFTNVELKVGEVMRFDVRALGIVGLKTYLWVTDKGYNPKVNRYHGKRLVYRLKMIIQTQGFIKEIYNMNDRLITYIDAKTFLPLLVYKNLREGNFKNKVKVVFFHKKGYALYSDKHGKKRNARCKIYPQTLDVVSLIYFIRKVKAKPGKTLHFSYLSGMGVVSTKTIMQKDHKRKCSIYFTDNKKHSHSKISQIGSHTVSMYVTNDKRRVPTCIVAESIQFDSRVKFKGYELSKFANLGAFLGYYGVKD